MRVRNPWWLAAIAIGTAVGIRAVRRRVKLEALRGQVALVTGGSRGLGLVIARELVRHGARVAICARDAVELERARVDLAGHGGEVTAHVCDVRDAGAVRALVATVYEQMGPIELVINNAGIIVVGPHATMTDADYRDAMDTHFWGPLHVISAVLPDMRERGAGRIVNIASIGGKLAVPHLGPYSASKFALVGLSAGLRAELAADGISLTTVCPGLMRTGSPRNAKFKGDHRAEHAWFTIGDSLPVLSMSAERAARQIIAAAIRGDAEIVLGASARIAALAHALAPNIVQDVLAAVNKTLPAAAAGDAERAARPGHDSESGWAPSLLTVLTDAAARRNNEG